MRTYKLYLIRHGMTQGNLESRYIGSTDTPLCKEGIDEIKSLYEEFEYPNVGKVYSSPMKRCLETAKIIYPSFTPEIIEGIREYDFGMLENKTLKELLLNPQYKEWVESGFTTSLGDSETSSQFQARVILGIDKIIMDMMDKKISEAAVICHGGVIGHILASCALPQRKPSEWMVGNGKGYTLLVNASLWGNNKTAEVYTAIPYGTNKINVAVGYDDIFHNIDQ
ncbi:MAG: histidine phosphatase family protein, partial [Oscillospiraceae bacterium]